MGKIKRIGVLKSGGDSTGMNSNRPGSAAVEALPDDQKSVLVGLQNGEIILVPFENDAEFHNDVNRELVAIADMLSVKSYSNL